MPQVSLKKLYMAKSLEELNIKVSKIPSAATKNLVKSSTKVFDNAELADKTKDEELAYIYYMKYYAIFRQISSQPDYRKDKRYFDSLMDLRKTKKAIQRAEELVKSLQFRYDILNSVVPKTQIDNLKNAEKSMSMTGPKKSSAASTNGTLKKEGFWECKRLYSLIQQRASSYLVVDIRPLKDFEESSMKISNVINIPEEIIRPGLTADKAGKELDERSRLLWQKRHSYDHLIFCDWDTDETPLPTPLTRILDAIEKWDPGKSYKSKPVILDGGYDLFRLMFPMLVVNPRIEHTASNLSFKSSVSSSANNVSLNFDYPDLDTAFISTPSPDRPSQFPSLGEDKPNFNRALKPSQIKPHYKDGFNSFPVPLDSSNSAENLNDVAFLDDSSKNLTNDNVSPKESPTNSIADYNAPIPSIPCRSLKPKELIQSLVAKKADIEEEEEMLEESYKLEQEALSKLKEVEATQKERDAASDESTRARLAAVENRLNEEICNLQRHSKAAEEKYDAMQKQNEELWKIIQTLSSELTISKDHTSTQFTDKLNADTGAAYKDIEDRKRQRQQQVLNLRRERKEKEKRLREQREIRDKERKAEEERIKEIKQLDKGRLSPAGDGRWAVERTSRSKDSPLGDRATAKAKGDTYTTKLKSSPRTSPVRGGSNLKRSHSALNLSQLRDTDGDFNQIMPSFNRNLKPLESPRRRNLNAARHRNFEPKYGSVGPAKTGLKNLGNTCYMNSIIQCLNNTAPFTRYFLEGHSWEDINPNSGQKGEVAEEVGAVIRALWCGQYRSIAMWDLKTAVGKYHRPFLGCDQQDSHEFLIMLMDWLHEDLNLVRIKYPPMKEQDFDSRTADYVAADQIMEELARRDDSIVRNLFHGLHRSVITCEACGHRSLTFEPFSILTVPIPTSGRCSLKDLIHDSYKESEIDYTCGRCRTMRKCLRKMDIWKLPSVLIIHLNRFEHDVLMKKKQNFIDFPLEGLDLSIYTARTVRQSSFSLYGVSNHYGTIDGGHYTAYCKSPNSRTWCKFDDHEVYELPRESVRSSAAYLLFYETQGNNVNVM